MAATGSRPMWLPYFKGRPTDHIIRYSGGRRPEPTSAVLSLGALILLNYLNASRALPNLVEQGTANEVVLAAIGGLSLVTLLNGCGAAAGLLAGGSRASRTAMLHAVGMSNTALASTLAVEFFPDRPQVLYPAIACTLFQHAVAALLTIARPDVSK